MSQVHPCARTTPRTRAEINASPAGATALACRYNITVATARKWKGREDSQDRFKVFHTTIQCELVACEHSADGCNFVDRHSSAKGSAEGHSSHVH